VEKGTSRKRGRKLGTRALRSSTALETGTQRNTLEKGKREPNKVKTVKEGEGFG